MSTSDADVESPPFVVLGDDVLLLRCLRVSDEAAMLAGEDDEQVRWLTEGRRSEPARTGEWVGKNQEQWRMRGPRRHLGIVDRATGALAGGVEAHLAIPELPAGSVNVSYWVFPQWRGRGYAARAVRLVCAWLRDATDGDTAVLRIDAENAPSLRVARDAGHVLVGPGPGGLLHHERPLGEPARVVLVCGPAGSGKSTHASRLERAGFARLSFDEEAWARGHRGHPVAASVAAEVHEHLHARLAKLVGQGRDVVVDTSFWSRVSRESYRALLAPFGVTPVVHHLATPREVVLGRLAGRSGDGPHQVTVPAGLAVAYLDGFEAPTPDEGPLVVVGPG